MAFQSNIEFSRLLVSPSALRCWPVRKPTTGRKAFARLDQNSLCMVETANDSSHLRQSEGPAFGEAQCPVKCAHQLDDLDRFRKVVKKARLHSAFDVAGHRIGA
jgi:hypothetical protein